ncbi:MAG TPA: hypothetical protein VGU45_01855 [Microvirga sp.]|jgi:hypothetical protein|nr:hypothetical protein [Microvirga sp.]
MALWGDLNAILNRLVSAGVIARFWTNLGQRQPLLALQIIVWPPGPIDDHGAEVIRSAVADQVAPLIEDVTITVSRDASAGP